MQMAIERDNYEFARWLASSMTIPKPESVIAIEKEINEYYADLREKSDIIRSDPIHLSALITPSGVI